MHAVNLEAEDLKLPSGFVFASIDEQIRAAREDLHRWIAVMEPRTRVDHGRYAMHPLQYAAGLQRRRSIVHTLLALQRGNFP